MRAIPSGLDTALRSGATTLSWCWRVARRDGVVYGFTDHDRDLTFDSTTYEAASGLTACSSMSKKGAPAAPVAAASAAAAPVSASAASTPESAVSKQQAVADAALADGLKSYQAGQYRQAESQ